MESLRAALSVLPLALLGCSSAEPRLGPFDPGPGDQVDIGFVNVPPNDTPTEATPLGTSTMSDVTVWSGENDIGGSTPANYFVFRSGPSAGQFAFDGCFSAPITSMTASLWEIVDGAQKDPPVGAWKSAQADGAGCFASATAPMDASTVYLFGLTAEGGAGTYSL